MDFFRRAWATIQSQMGKLPATSKWLIGSLLVILLMVGFLTVQYAGSPEMVVLVSATADRSPEMVTRLESAGIKAQAQGGQIMVPEDKRSDAFAILAQGDLLAGNTAAAFDEMIKNQNPWTTRDQNAQAFLLATQKTLGQIIAKFVGVRAADVIISVPEETGFGATHRRGSAAVNIVMQGGATMNNKLVEAIAGLVAAGAHVEMKPEDVVVIDANQGRQFTVKKQNGGMSGDNVEALESLERYYHDKIADALIYIPGKIVAVNVRLDPVLVKDETQTTYSPEPLKGEESEESETHDASGGGEAGVRPNTGASIDAGVASGSSTKTTKSRTDYGETKVVGQTVQHSMGGMPKQINVTVNVPRSFFVGIYKQGKPADAPEPDEAALEAIKTAQLAQIEGQVKPLISTDSAGVVTVNMIPDPLPMGGFGGTGAGGAGGGTAASAAGGAVALLQSDWIKPAGLFLLAVVSLGLMFGMVRKATQQSAMPSVEELAGVPPVLASEEELVGEAEATEATMAGVELDEDQMRTRKIAEQITEMVKTSPAEAANLFGRWIRKEG